jgi:hypothetical protein
MKLTQRTLAILVFVTFLDFAKASPPGGRIYPRANEEATEKLKEAYAAYYQGWYERAIELAMDVYQKYGDVHARWWPSWVSAICIYLSRQFWVILAEVKRVKMNAIR